MNTGLGEELMEHEEGGAEADNEETKEREESVDRGHSDGMDLEDAEPTATQGEHLCSFVLIMDERIGVGERGCVIVFLPKLSFSHALSPALYIYVSLSFTLSLSLSLSLSLALALSLSPAFHYKRVKDIWPRPPG